MKRGTGLLLFLAILSVVSGYLMSKASLIGKAGMSLFYQEYNFLKSWWKGALLIFILLLILYAVHIMLLKKYPLVKAKTITIVSCIIAIIGLYFTYNDFRHTLSHRLLGERFHLGVYLFWIGWMVISLFSLVKITTTGTPAPVRQE
jgi:hypothetical protein